MSVPPEHLVQMDHIDQTKIGLGLTKRMFAFTIFVTKKKIRSISIRLWAKLNFESFIIEQKLQNRFWTNFGEIQVVSLLVPLTLDSIKIHHLWNRVEKIYASMETRIVKIQKDHIIVFVILAGKVMPEENVSMSMSANEISICVIYLLLLRVQKQSA